MFPICLCRYNLQHVPYKPKWLQLTTMFPISLCGYNLQLCSLYAYVVTTYNYVPYIPMWLQLTTMLPISLCGYNL